MNLNNITSLVSEPSTSKNILTSDVELTGTLKFDSEMIFDGKLDGEIISEGTLILGKNAVVKGEVRTKSVTIHGTVNGNVTVQERCELKSNAELLGDLKAMRIIIEEGATFIGHSEVTPSKSGLASRSTSPSKSTPIESAA
ncbi:MAG: polymer-forming cytoskeletal protein [Verrucomicrobiota bacterium]